MHFPPTLHPSFGSQEPTTRGTINSMRISTKGATKKRPPSQAPKRSRLLKFTKSPLLNQKERWVYRGRL